MIEVTTMDHFIESVAREKKWTFADAFEEGRQIGDKVSKEWHIHGTLVWAIMNVVKHRFNIKDKYPFRSELGSLHKKELRELHRIAVVSADVSEFVEVLERYLAIRKEELEKGERKGFKDILDEDDEYDEDEDDEDYDDDDDK